MTQTARDAQPNGTGISNLTLFLRKNRFDIDFIEHLRQQERKQYLKHTTNHAFKFQDNMATEEKRNKCTFFLKKKEN